MADVQALSAFVTVKLPGALPLRMCASSIAAVASSAANPNATSVARRCG